MAFSGEAESLVWQRVDIALANASPAAQMYFYALKRWLAQQKSTPNLQFVAFDRTTNGSDTTNTDTVICGATAHLWGLYGKQPSGASNAAFLKISNHATAIQAASQVLLDYTTAADENVYISATGMSFATGLVLATVTTYNGTTHSLKADSCDGFAIIAA